MAKITKRNAAKLLAKVPDEYVFRVSDGGVLSDMKELAQELNHMSDETFTYHANATKNDFSNWLKDIIGDNELASKLRLASSRTQAAKYVADRVASLHKIAA